MTEYPSDANPVDRALADAAHADALHNRTDRDNWFGLPPVGAPGEPPPPFTAAPGTNPPYTTTPERWNAPARGFARVINSDDRPSFDDPGTYLPRVDTRCGYLVGGWRCGRPEGHAGTPETCDPAAIIAEGQPAGDFTPEATLIAAAVRCCVPPDAETPHEAYCPVYGYPPPVTRDADPVTPGPVSTTVERLAAMLDDALPKASWAQIAAWARAADDRVYSDLDDSLNCQYGQHSETGHDIGTFYWIDVHDRAQPMQSLVAFIARHWECGPR